MKEEWGVPADNHHHVWDEEARTRVQRRVTAYSGALQLDLVQEGWWPPPIESDASTILPPTTALKGLGELRAACEETAHTMLQSHSSRKWLETLRLLPWNAFTWPGALPTTGMAVRDIAETLSTLAPSNSAQQKTGDGLDGDISAAVPIIAVANVLRRVHSAMRLAGKGVSFEWARDLSLMPSCTHTQRVAIDLYDQRVRVTEGDFSTGGVTLSQPGAPLPSPPFGLDILTVQRLEQGFVLPASLSNAWGIDECETSFCLHTLNLSRLANLNSNIRPRTHPPDVVKLALLLHFARRLLSRRPELLLRTHLKGYLEAPEESVFVDAIAQCAEELQEFQFRVFGFDEPVNADDILWDLKQVQACLWPTRLGPVIRSDSRSTVVDLVAASAQLAAGLRFVGHTMGRERGRLFEVVVQETIDDSPWGQIPDTLRECVGVQLVSSGGKAITDIDAIGMKAGTVLLVDCLSRLKEPDRHLAGDNRAYLQDARRVEDKVSGAKGRPEHGWAAKCSRVVGRRGRNFDLRAFHDCICVVVTPVPVYIEESLVGRDPGALRQITHGLLAVSSYAEFRSWLNDGA